MKINKLTINPVTKQIFKSNKMVKNSSSKCKDSGYPSKNLYPQGIQYWIEIHKPDIEGLNNIQTTTLKNNVVLNLDSNSPDNKAALELRTVPTLELDANPAVKALYAKMIKYFEIEGEDNNTGVSSINGKCIEISAQWDNGKFPDIIKRTLQKAYNPTFTEKELQYAKEVTLANFDSLQQVDALKLIYSFKPYTKEDVKNVSLDNIKKYHNDLVSNSMTLCAVSIPKRTDNKTTKEITDIIENEIPRQKTFDNQSVSNQIIPIKEATVVHLKPSDENKKITSRFYLIPNNYNLNDAAVLALIGEILENIMIKNCPANVNDFSCSCYVSNWNRYFEILVMLEDKNITSEDFINSAIKQVINKGIDKDVLEESKEKVLSKMKKSLKQSRLRANMLAKIYSQGMFDYDKFSSILNSITPEELQQTAQRYFSSPCITEIKE